MHHAKNPIWPTSAFWKIAFSHEWSDLSDFDDLGVYFDVFDGGQFIKAHFKAKKVMHHAKNPIWLTLASLENSIFS